MANESRSFRLIGGVTVENIVEAVDTYCRINKSMETQSSKTTDGYVLQASQPGNGWKTISGTRLAITTQFMVVGDVLTVTVGQGQWADKVGAAAVAWFIAWPFAVSAGIGALRQKKLPEEIFNIIERTILTGGVQVVINGAGSILKEGVVVCPKCKSRNADTARFCVSCGSALSSVCPKCGQAVTINAKFCPSCGQNLEEKAPEA
ncbi:MAG: zinc ribbon domain-containing protein [Clostridia bacterium]|nr:zinc ribbon domain-containing protein [Clostridia bacterium]